LLNTQILLHHRRVVAIFASDCHEKYPAGKKLG